MNLWCESNATSSKTRSLHVHWDNVLTVQTNISRSLVFSALILLRYASVLDASCILINSPLEFCTFLPFHVSYYATAVSFIATSSMYTWCTLFLHLWFRNNCCSRDFEKQISDNKEIIFIIFFVCWIHLLSLTSWYGYAYYCSLYFVIFVDDHCNKWVISLLFWETGFDVDRDFDKTLSCKITVN